MYTNTHPHPNTHRGDHNNMLPPPWREAYDTSYRTNIFRSSIVIRTAIKTSILKVLLKKYMSPIGPNNLPPTNNDRGYRQMCRKNMNNPGMH